MFLVENKTDINITQIDNELIYFIRNVIQCEKFVLQKYLVVRLDQ